MSEPLASSSNTPSDNDKSKGNKKNHLPETGESKGIMMTVIGVVMVSMIMIVNYKKK
ncbi:MAG: LPXTG cell wall anchor domain-containing protein [Vagococcus sp.]